ncbi:Carboxylesterase A precursor [Streptomyces sp. YIM 121038]|uniref:alpha/beta fold hydrolase n=1 Tax=Streptomyces sp. YIM 121038 TaxID=2136401 RepID=UPI001110F1AB|nr:alpha/beta fold hydrolase [Streptomyces sp. YIM 121038]QCX81844.1 Carboxylesterase A precursor [Streptomyces sp. YIM 121038]
MPRIPRTPVCALGVAALAVSLTACGGSYNPFDDHQERATYRTGAEAKKDRTSVPRWLPDDARDISYVISTTGGDRIMRFTAESGGFPASCVRGEPQGKPRLKADWFPSDVAAKADVNCGTWSGARIGGALYAWQDRDVASGARDEAAVRIPEQRIAWKACRAEEGVPKGADCGTVRVPVDWREPGGKKIDIAVARRTAAEPDRRVGTLVFLPGGPGSSGVDTVRATDTWGGLERRFDIVSLDPRGVGASSAVRCPAKPYVAMVRDKKPAASAAEFARERERAGAFAEDCARASGPVAAHTDATSVSHDVEAVRAALGEDRVSLYGHSYGTLYGQRYAQLYGERVRAAVLDGVMDPAVGRRDFNVTSARALERAFGEFARWCGKNDACALGDKDPRAVLRRVAAKAADGTLRNDGKKVTLAALNGTLDQMLLTPSWPVVGEYLQALDSGKPWQEDGEEPGGKLLPVADQAVCVDLNLRAPDAAAYLADQKAAREAAPAFGFSPNAVGYANLCLGLPERPTPRPATPGDFRTEHPMLLINARYDNATPVDWARSAARHLGDKAALVEVDGWGHGAKVFNGGAERKAVTDYLTRLITPAPGTVIKGSVPPGA